MHGVYLSPESPVPPSGPSCVAVTESPPWGPSPEGLPALEGEVGPVLWALVAIYTFITILTRPLPRRSKEQGWGTPRPPAARTAKWLGSRRPGRAQDVVPVGLEWRRCCCHLQGCVSRRAAHLRAAGTRTPAPQRPPVSLLPHFLPSPTPGPSASDILGDP